MKNNGRSKQEQAQNENQHQKKAVRKINTIKKKINHKFQIWLLINESFALLFVTKT